MGSVIHKCDDETQGQLRDAIKILSSTELYAPTITRFRDNDRIATGYYDGLIRVFFKFYNIQTFFSFITHLGSVNAQLWMPFEKINIVERQTVVVSELVVLWD